MSDIIQTTTTATATTATDSDQQLLSTDNTTSNVESTSDSGDVNASDDSLITTGDVVADESGDAVDETDENGVASNVDDSNVDDSNADDSNVDDSNVDDSNANAVTDSVAELIEALTKQFFSRALFNRSVSAIQGTGSQLGELQGDLQRMALAREQADDGDVLNANVRFRNGEYELENESVVQTSVNPRTASERILDTGEQLKTQIADRDVPLDSQTIQDFRQRLDQIEPGDLSSTNANRSVNQAENQEVSERLYQEMLLDLHTNPPQFVTSETTAVVVEA